MKKYKYLILILIFLIIIPLIVLYIQFYSPKSQHYEQVFFRYNGYLNVPENSPFSFLFTFVDKEEYSEMHDINNIKSVSLVTGNNKKIHVDKWDIPISGGITNGYILRKMQASIASLESGIYSLTKLEIIFQDGVKESYDIGNLRINCGSPKSVNDVALIYSINKKIYTYSGALISCDKYAKDEVVIRNVDLGLEGFEVDTENVHVIYDTLSNTESKTMEFKYSKIIPDWYEPFVNLRINPNYDSGKHIPVSLPKNESSANNMTILIPFICTDEKYLNTYNLFNIENHAEINGKEKVISSRLYESPPNLPPIMK